MKQQRIFCWVGDDDLDVMNVDRAPSQHQKSLRSPSLATASKSKASYE
jgi:hypothetical protein